MSVTTFVFSSRKLFVLIFIKKVLVFFTMIMIMMMHLFSDICFCIISDEKKNTNARIKGFSFFFFIFRL